MRRSPWPKAFAAAAALLMCAGLTACGAQQGARDGRTITVWSLENLTERMSATQKVVDRFTQKTGIQVRLVGIDENQLGQLIMSSAAAGRLPDVIGAVPLSSVRTTSTPGPSTLAHSS
jgi:multiple sugar transport system substrate-binding protein